MYRTDFPNLTWLKKQIDRGFEHNNLRGWPNVIIQAKTNSEHRPNIKGTLSVFSNIRGQSSCAAEHYRVTIPEDYFFISNNQQEYSLDIEAAQPVETFNIHFSEMLLQDISNNLQQTQVSLLDGADKSCSLFRFYNRLYRKDERFLYLTQIIRNKAAANDLSDAEQEELLTELLHHLVQQNMQIRKQVNTLDAEKRSTREELYRRLLLASDYIAAHYSEALSLDKLAEVACLSKFHFLRLFKSAFKQSPCQYISSLRMERAKKLLQDSSFEIQQIAGYVGYENSNSFCRAFLKHTQCSPDEFRKRKLLVSTY